LKNRNNAGKASGTTDQLLKDTFIQIYKNKPLNKISVKEICSTAGLNRGTFYIHYENIYTLLEEIEEDLLTDLKSLVKIDKLIVYTEKDIPVFIKTIENLIEYIKLHDTYFKVLLGKNGDALFIYKIKRIIKNNLLIKFRAENRHFGNLDEYLLEYIASGNMGIMIYWLETGMKISPGELIGLVTKILFRGPFNIR
jgi:AcrR family transcriptional regulator